MLPMCLQRAPLYARIGEHSLRMLKKSGLLTRPTLADISPTRPESAEKPLRPWTRPVPSKTAQAITLKGVAGMIPTARIGRAPFYRARSASTGIVPATPTPFFSSCLAAKGLFGHSQFAFDHCADGNQSLRRGGFKPQHESRLGI